MAPTRQHRMEEFLESARTLGRLVWAGKVEQFRKLKLHPSQVRVLYFVRHKPVTLSEVARAMGATPSAATQLVNGLVRSGYIERVTDPTDRRRVTLTISRRGRARFEAMRAAHLRQVQRLLAPLTDRELSTLVSIHAKIAYHPNR